MHGANFAGPVTLETGGSGEVDPRVAALKGGSFLLAVVYPISLGPLRPRVVFGPVLGGARENLQLDDAGAPLADRGGYAISAGVATADDDDVLPCGGDRLPPSPPSTALVAPERNSMAK